MKRNDLIVARYTKNTSTNVEAVDLVIIKGTSDASDPSDPAHTEGDITNGSAVLHDFPLWRIPLDGLNVGEPERLFAPFIDSMRTLPVIRQQVLDIHAEVDEQLAGYDVEMAEKISKIESYLKDEVLTDSTKALYGFGSAAVPNDVFVALNNNLNEAVRCIKKCVSAESGVGLTFPSYDIKTVDFTTTVTFGLENKIAEGKEVVFINGINYKESEVNSFNSQVSYNAKLFLVINGVEYTLLSEKFAHSGLSSMESLKRMKSCNVNIFAAFGVTIKAGDSVAIKIAQEAVSGGGYRTVTLSDVTLDVRVL
jgi:hypothetical protein